MTEPLRLIKNQQWCVAVYAGVDLNLGPPPPTLYLEPGQVLEWCTIDCRLRIRMCTGSGIKSCKFGRAVQIDTPASKEEPLPVIAYCNFEGYHVGFEFPEPYV